MLFDEECRLSAYCFGGSPGASFFYVQPLRIYSLLMMDRGFLAESINIDDLDTQMNGWRNIRVVTKTSKRDFHGFSLFDGV